MSEQTKITFTKQPVEPESVLYLDSKDGKLKFEGNMAKSGKIFFEGFLKPACDNYIEQRLKEIQNG